MTVKELKEMIKNLKDDARIMIVDDEQEQAWEIKELRTCEDCTSKDFNNYLDVVIG